MKVFELVYQTVELKWSEFPPVFGSTRHYRMYKTESDAAAERDRLLGLYNQVFGPTHNLTAMVREIEVQE